MLFFQKGVAEIAHAFTDVEFLLNTLDDMISSKGERLTRVEMVKDILFDGFNVQPYVDLANDPMVQSAGEVSLPERILDGKMGILEGVCFVLVSGLSKTQIYLTYQLQIFHIRIKTSVKW